MEKLEATETDAAVIAMTIAICDAFIQANQISAEALASRLSVAQESLGRAPRAAGIIQIVRTALLDPQATAQRNQLVALLTQKAPGSKN